MLRKLIKHEWKNTGKVCGLLILFLVIMTVLACLSFCTPMWRGVFTDEVQSTPMILLGVMFLILYIFAIVGVIYGIMIYLGVHFFKSMYSDEGYLTHTLPVTAHQLLVSKILVAGLWYLVVMVLMLISVFSLMFTFAGMVFAAEGMNFFEELAANWDDFMRGVEYALGDGLLGGILLYILQIVIGTFCSVIMLFGAITIGQLSSKYKVMMSILSYFGISIVLQIISAVVMVPVSYYSTQAIMESTDAVVSMTTMPTFVVTIALNLISAIVLYFISNFIITRKLNLD